MNPSNALPTAPSQGLPLTDAGTRRNPHADQVRRGNCQLIADNRPGIRRALRGTVIALGLATAALAEPKAACCAAPPPPAAESSATSLHRFDAAFTTDAGTPLTLAGLRGRPVVLTMFFASCHSACPLLLADLARLRTTLPADVAERAVFVLVSFDPGRDTPEALQRFRADRGLDDRWILLHADAGTVRELAAVLGIKYRLEADGQYAHSNLLTVLDPAGEVVHRRAGLGGELETTAVALVKAAR